MEDQGNGLSAIITFQNVSFSYPGRQENTLSDISFQVGRGESVLITGPTGCGKSTLLKMLNGIIPLESSGRMTGDAVISGENTKTGTVSGFSRIVGLVFQSPDDQLFCNTVQEEVAFGPWNLGMQDAEIEIAVNRSLAATGMAGHESARTDQLSGGRKQRVAIATQLAMEPAILALDEPLSQLDPNGAGEVVTCLNRLKNEGMTIVIVEHRLSEVLPLVGRIILMDGGRVVLDLQKSQLPDHLETFERLGLQVPDVLRIGRVLGCRFGADWEKDLMDQVVNAVRPFIAHYSKTPLRCETKPPGKTAVSLKNILFSYNKNGKMALDDVSLDVMENETVAIMGHNGSGKSTLLSLIAGLNRPRYGTVSVFGRNIYRNRNKIPKNITGMLFQNPDLQLIEETVEKELKSGPANLKMKKAAAALSAVSVSEKLALSPFLHVPPFALSKGQRLRVALGAILTMGPGILLMDEPTTGQNRKNIERLLQVIQHDSEIKAVIFCSHDMDTVCRFADRVILLKDGRIIAQGKPGEIVIQTDLLRETGLAPTFPIRLSLRTGITPPAPTCEDFLRGAGC